MVSTITAVLAATCLAGTALAGPMVRHENCDPAQQPFNLTVTSISSGKYKDAPLNAAHSGAAEEALAVLPGDFGTSFTFNQSDIVPPTDFCGVGYLQYTVPASPAPFTEKLEFVQNKTSNVEAAFFGEGDGPVLLTFSNSNEMFYYDDVKVQDAYWYVCPQTSLGYQYETLSHVNNGAKPDNADCDQVIVKKVHIP